MSLPAPPKVSGTPRVGHVHKALSVQSTLAQQSVHSRVQTSLEKARFLTRELHLAPLGLFCSISTIEYPRCRGGLLSRLYNIPTLRRLTEAVYLVGQNKVWSHEEGNRISAGDVGVRRKDEVRSQTGLL